MWYCPYLNVVGRQLLLKMSSWLVKMRNSKGSEEGGEKLNTKSVNIAQNAIQITHKVMKDTTAVALFQEVRAWLLCSFDCVAPAPALKKLLSWVHCLERNGC
jgi:hypothetical protein